MRRDRPAGIEVVPGSFVKAGLLEQLHPEEIEAIKEFRSRCDACIHYDDYFLASCLFSMKCNIDRAITLLENNWKWRVENDFEILPQIDEVDFTHMKSFYTLPGVRSKSGSGVAIMNLDGFDPSQVELRKLLTFMVWYFSVGHFHAGMDAVRNGLVVIEDLEGLGWKHVDLKLQRELGHVTDSTFPIRFEKILMVNSPGIIRFVIAVVRPFIKKKLMNRFDIVKTNVLPDYIDKEYIPSEFGGEFKYSYDEWVSMMKEYVDYRSSMPNTIEEEENLLSSKTNSNQSVSPSSSALAQDAGKGKKSKKNKK